MPKDECGPLPHPTYKNELKMDHEDLKELKLLTLLKENIGMNLRDLGLGKGFLNIKPKGQEKFF